MEHTLWLSLALSRTADTLLQVRRKYMSTIKNLIDLAKELETRARDRRDIETIHQITSLAFSLQSQHAEVIEKNLNLAAENLELTRQVSEFPKEIAALKEAQRQEITKLTERYRKEIQIAKGTESPDVIAPIARA
jgi:glutamate/tyrosine decarboxylase-like PLP-dependent enzyme